MLVGCALVELGCYLGLCLWCLRLVCCVCLMLLLGGFDGSCWFTYCLVFGVLLLLYCLLGCFGLIVVFVALRLTL